MPKDMNSLLKLMVEKNASDIHLSCGAPAQLRIDEKLVSVDNHPLTQEETKAMVYSLLSDIHKEKFERDLELDMAFGVKGLGRFRVNVFQQRGTIATSIRLIPYTIWTFEQCGLPVNVVLDLCQRPKGLVLVTGATGSGKSTSLASMIDWINSNRSCHIVTIEDPIEFIHSNKKAIVDQRCVICHNAQVANKNIRLDSVDAIKANAQLIYQQAVVQKTMPMNNASGITDAERASLGRWFAAGAK